MLEGGDWRRFRPKVVVAEALAPVTLTPSFEEWEPLLTDNDYQFALFDGLNRYYVAGEHAGLAQRLAAPIALDGIAQVRAFRPALDDISHPDHGLARWFAGEDMVRLPLLGPNRPRRTADSPAWSRPDRTARRGRRTPLRCTSDCSADRRRPAGPRA